MNFSKAGIILQTANYPECVAFHGNILGLETLFQIDRPGERITAFDMGGVYLMIETGGQAHDDPKPISASPVKLRFNVSDVCASARALEAAGVSVDVQRHSWGETAEFSDPDGNRCALRSEAGFGV